MMASEERERVKGERSAGLSRKSEWDGCHATRNYQTTALYIEAPGQAKPECVYIYMYARVRRGEWGANLSEDIGLSDDIPGLSYSPTSLLRL